MTKKMLGHHPARYLVAWVVHAFTASAACLGLLTLINLYQHNFIQAFWCMAIAVIIDAIDGTFARLAHVKTILPNIDGALLDNIVDYLNYVITPCFFLFVKADMLPPNYSLAIIMAIVMTSSYQFCQNDAKTADHFFKGFPCYWNFAVFYMFLANTSAATNAIILSILCILIFVPIKYVYPSRLDYLTESKKMKILMHAFSFIFLVSTAMIIWEYPNQNKFWLGLSIGYVVIYLLLSFYRTYSPMIKLIMTTHRD